MVQVLHPFPGFLNFDNNGEATLAVTRLEDGSCPVNHLANLDILYSCGYGNYWMRQWPIGTGKIGALVGGAPNRERIPVAISDLFLGEKREVGTWRSFIDAAANGGEASGFEESSRLLSNGYFGQADRAAGAMDSYPGQCTFEFMADINLNFDSPSPKLTAVPNPRPPVPQVRIVTTTNRNQQRGSNPKGDDKHISMLNLPLGLSGDLFVAFNLIKAAITTSIDL